MGQDTFTEKKLFHEQLAFKYFLRLRGNRKPTEEVSQEQLYHILNAAEQRAISKIERKALFWAAMYGVLGVLVLYLPYYFFPTLFPQSTFYIGEERFTLGLVFIVYGFVLVAIELVALSLLNLWAVHRIADICQFPPAQDPRHDEYLEALFIVGMEKKSKKLLNFGINPLAGISKVQLMLYTALFLFKATISNLLLKIVLRRLSGRLVIRAYVDLIGIPVFAFWNAYATALVIKEAKVRIMAPTLIEEMSRYLQQRVAPEEDFRQLIYHTLQIVAMFKRNFHYNHYLLANTLVVDFQIANQTYQFLDKITFLSQLRKLEGAAKEGFAKLFVFGMLIDGHISLQEERVLRQLYQDGTLLVSPKQVKYWTKQFLKGKGLDEFFALPFTQEYSEAASFHKH